MKIIFMGTPEFAVPSLRILQDGGYDVVGVITAVDKMGGRGKKRLLESAVKKYAADQGLKIFQPKNLKNEGFLEEISALQADLQVVVAFRMLPEVLWNMPLLGTINLHGSLLPAYRGAAPINWAIINGETKTGVTTFFLKHEIDTGDILMQRSMSVGPDDSAGEVHDRMMKIGSEVILESIKKIESGNYTLQAQDQSLISKAPKIYTEDCEIDFYLEAKKVHDHIRGLSPLPTAWTLLEGKKLKVFKAALSNEISLRPGELRILEKTRLIVGCGSGSLELLEIQPEGRKRMSTRDFLNGYKLEGSVILGEKNEMKKYPVEKSEEEWRAILEPEAYRVLRERGTERSFVGAYTNTEDKGSYHCGACEYPLFESEQKYHSGCGWPSFWGELESASIEQIKDTSHGMIRTELVCSNCGSHLGHIFNDGPSPSGKRYCINSVSLKFHPQP